jgi:hypothetical protein
LLVVTHVADEKSLLIATHAPIIAIASHSARIPAWSISRAAHATALLSLPRRGFGATARVLILGKTVADGTSQENRGGCYR